MSRGESESKEGRSRSVAIGVSFGLVCLAALTLVLRTTNFIEDFHSPWANVPPPEPVVGVYAALRSVPGVCANPSGGPTMPGPAATAGPGHTVTAWLVDQGMVELPEGRRTLSLPGRVAPEWLDEGCGYIVVIPEPGATLPTRATWNTAEGQVGVLPYCERQNVEVAGSGIADLRVFTLPGVSGDAPARTRLTTSLLLRMAMAEAALARRGFIPSTSYVVEEVSAGAPNAYPRLSTPATPSSGCVAWLAAAEGFDGASASFEGQPLGTACDAWGGQESGFTLGLLSCAPTSTATGASELTFHDASGSGGRVVYRPFGIAPAGPRALGAPPASTVGALREATGGSITLPVAAPRREP